MQFDQIRASTPRPTESDIVQIFDIEPDDCDLLAPPTARPHFIRIMTAISEVESLATRRTGRAPGQVHEPLSTVPPHPWGSPPVDRFICALDACDLDPADAIQQIKLQFPKLANCIITENILVRRLMVLDQRLDIDYFKDIQDVLSLQQKGGGHWQEVRTMNKLKAAREELSNGDCQRTQDVKDRQVSVNGTDLSRTDTSTQTPRHSKPPVITSDNCENHLATVDEEDNPDAYCLENDNAVCDNVDNMDDSLQKPAELDKKTLPRAVKHGLAIHRNHGQAWESLAGGDQLAGTRSIRRINSERQEDARRRAVKLGLAIHKDHNEKWEQLKSGLGHLRTRSKSIKKSKQSIELPMSEKENVMPTPLRVQGEVVGIVPAGVLKSLDAGENKSMA